MSLHLEKFIYVDKTYFLLTAYTGGSFVIEKKNHTLNYIKQIRKYYPNSYVVLIDSINDKDICNVCDLYICELLNNNTPYGQGDLDKIKIGLNLLEGIGAKFVIRSAYDYWINDIIFEQQKQWIQLINKGKKIVSSYWRGTPNDQEDYKSINTGYGCYDIQAAKKLFNLNKMESNSLLEHQIYNNLIKYFYPYEYFMYETCYNMFNSHTYDIFNFAGTVLHQERLNSTL